MKLISNFIRASIREVVDDPKWMPYSGLHDDHRAADGTAAYRPAMMQVEDELVEFIQVCQEHCTMDSLLQIGIGNCLASHYVWKQFFKTVVSIDVRDYGHPDCVVGGSMDKGVLDLMFHMTPFDVVFIDGDHTFTGALMDYGTYSMRAKHIVAMHDAIARDGYTEIGVPRIVKEERLNVIGMEVGIAWRNRQSR